MKILPLVLLLILPAAIPGSAQKIISVDAAYIHKLKSASLGINISSFYHFSEKIALGFEMNRLFKHTRVVNEEEISTSAWDFDLNVHYNISLNKNIFFYPVAGISHTSEKEINTSKAEPEFNRFYSFNTGAGIFWKFNNITPFAESLCTWGRVNQQFFLVGIGYEFELRIVK